MLFALTLSISYLVLRMSQEIHAAQKENWKAGNIIDDTIFTDKDSMSVSDIQTFLDEKIGSCDIWGTGKASEYGSSQTRAQYATARGWASPPYTCLNKYYEVPKLSPGGDLPANNYSSPDTIPNGAQSAAWIIKDAATRYNISPKVLLVKIATESIGPLTSDNWPLFSQYRYAMGSHCPDSGPNGSANCDSNYAGFSIQIYSAAQLMRWYLDSMDQPWWSYKKPYQTNSIMWNVSERGCGAGDVFLENKATAALYTYTPYQPNQAALNNLYGSGDSCSAYGNRNFWRVFTDWFGSTNSAAYEARFDSQSALEEPFYPGESRVVYIQYKNTGSTRWYDDTSVPVGSNPTHLAASVPTNRQSVFSYNWPSSGRPNVNFTRVYESNGTTLAANQHIVEPGQIARFEFTVTPPWNISLGVHREHFQPVLENASNWSMGGIAWLDITVESRYKATFHSQSDFPLIQRNSDISQNYIRYKNTGSAAWYDTSSVPNGYYPTKLVTAGPVGRTSQLGALWPNPNTAADKFSKVYESNGTTLAANQHIVMPGQIAQFDFKLSANANATTGLYRELLQPRLIGSNYPDMGGLSWIDATVTAPEYKAAFHSQSNFPTIARGQSSLSFIQYKNTGTARWFDDTSVTAGMSPIHLAASAPTNRQSVFSYGWVSAGRPNFTFSKVYEADGTTLAANQHIVEPGQIARFEFTVTAPWNVNTGTHREYFQPVLEWANEWSLNGVAWLDIKVTP